MPNKVATKTMDQILGLDLDPRSKDCNSTNTKLLNHYNTKGNVYRFCKDCKTTRFIYNA